MIALGGAEYNCGALNIAFLDCFTQAVSVNRNPGAPPEQVNEQGSPLGVVSNLVDTAEPGEWPGKDFHPVPGLMRPLFV